MLLLYAWKAAHVADEVLIEVSGPPLHPAIPPTGGHAFATGLGSSTRPYLDLSIFGLRGSEEQKSFPLGRWAYGGAYKLIYNRLALLFLIWGCYNPMCKMYSISLCL